MVIVGPKRELVWTVKFLPVLLSKTGTAFQCLETRNTMCYIGKSSKLVKETMKYWIFDENGEVSNFSNKNI